MTKNENEVLQYFLKNANDKIESIKEGLKRNSNSCSIETMLAEHPNKSVAKQLETQLLITETTKQTLEKILMAKAGYTIKDLV
jgi:hypothetical protein